MLYDDGVGDGKKVEGKVEEQERKQEEEREAQAEEEKREEKREQEREQERQREKQEVERNYKEAKQKNKEAKLKNKDLDAAMTAVVQQCKDRLKSSRKREMQLEQLKQEREWVSEAAEEAVKKWTADAVEVEQLEAEKREMEREMKLEAEQLKAEKLAIEQEGEQLKNEVMEIKLQMKAELVKAKKENRVKTKTNDEGIKLTAYSDGVIGAKHKNGLSIWIYGEDGTIKKINEDRSSIKTFADETIEKINEDGSSILIEIINKTRAISAKYANGSLLLYPADKSLAWKENGSSITVLMSLDGTIEKVKR
jgi:hypothetical protein